jgi:eukaryotic-like serine/threonine-protein kinase
MAIYEFCPGNNLYKYLQANSKKSRDVPYLKRVFGCLIAALDHIHSKGYIHCDLKPENILVNASGDPVLADFGSLLSNSARG